MTIPGPDSWAYEMAVTRKSHQWFADSNPSTFVSTRHHTVPAFILRRFADDGRRLDIWRWSAGQIKPGAVSDLAIKSFYTMLNANGRLDGRIEELLGQVEQAAAPDIDWLLSPLRGRKISQDKRANLCSLIAFQLLRGPRKRKEIELQGDYYWKITNEQALTPAELRDITAVPHPNEHLQIMMKAAQPLAAAMASRPLTVIWLDQPLLVISDEPVLIDIDNHVRHIPQCELTAVQRAQRQEDDIVHVWPTRPAGVEIADAIAMPVRPDALIALGPKGHDGLLAIRYEGDEAGEVAREVNTALVNQATEWVAASPTHPSFKTWTFPERSAILGVCDGGSIMSQQMQAAPVLKWQRIRKPDENRRSQ